MPQQPPVPEANQPPYPIEESPHHRGDAYFDDTKDDDRGERADGFSLPDLFL